MNMEAVGTLKYFSRFEKRTDGDLIDWRDADETLFSHLDNIRGELVHPIHIIREAHPDRAWAAVDWTSSAPMELVMQVVGPRPLGFGLYAGVNGPSYHVDLQGLPTPFGRYPRWMAIKPEYKSRLENFGHLITNQNDDWIYFRWNHPDSFDALKHVMWIGTWDGGNRDLV